MNGGTLFEYQNICRVLSIKEAVDYLRDIIEAVTEMHSRSIVHRDIKPENVVLTTTGVAKLCDFGWASTVDKNRKTYCGTLQYVSP
jgi:serine/threonine protein kinase